MEPGQSASVPQKNHPVPVGPWLGSVPDTRPLDCRASHPLRTRVLEFLEYARKLSTLAPYATDRAFLQLRASDAPSPGSDSDMVTTTFPFACQRSTQVTASTVSAKGNVRSSSGAACPHQQAPPVPAVARHRHLRSPVFTAFVPGKCAGKGVEALAHADRHTQFAAAGRSCWQAQLPVSTWSRLQQSVAAAFH